ncbi:hypothetical protein OPV22_034294 [Ensete ventricosum]|uniref:Uncharacterized protein n=1 Tax=Ensete ventricosum TaxID=4639 RepID=A0AAV8PWV6_ENSVE|nr:hypothetical protein OPV22_034294 [Ensete ventricosum]
MKEGVGKRWDFGFCDLRDESRVAELLRTRSAVTFSKVPWFLLLESVDLSGQSQSYGVEMLDDSTAALVDASSSFPSPTTEHQELGRQSLKEVGFPPPNCAGKEKAEMIHRPKESKLKVSSLGNEHKKQEEGEGLIIYNADYSLVSTHPPPLHKHSKP